MKLKTIEIFGLWHRYNVKWDLRPDVNILTGLNGGGKSTMLDIIASLLSLGKIHKSLISKVEKAILTFEDGTRLISVNYSDSVEKLQEKAKTDSDYEYMWEKVEKDIEDDDERVNYAVEFGVSFVEKNGEKLVFNDFLDSLNLDQVSTFDVSIMSLLNHKNVFKKDYDELRTQLDFELKEKIEQYAFYIGELSNIVEKKVLSGEPIDADSLRSIYKNKNIFSSVINELYSETQKEVVVKNGRLNFLLKGTDKYINFYELSSGEKQLLYIMLTALLEDEKPCICFMDEPELSLHIDWQEKLIEKMKILNPQSQLLIVSHSPFLFVSGWQECVKNIEDLKTKL